MRLLLAAFLLLSTASFGQNKKNQWLELKGFQKLITTTYKAAERGNFDVVTANADTLLQAAKALKASTIPNTYKYDITNKTLTQLVTDCHILRGAAKEKSNNIELMALISGVNDTFKRIETECKKEEE